MNTKKHNPILSGRTRMNKLSRKPLFLGCAIFMGAISQQAAAACAQTGSTVNCTGVPVVLGNPYSNAQDGLTVNVANGAVVSSLLGLGQAMSLTGNNVTFNNSGTISPNFLGVLSALSEGTVIGNANASNHTITNNGNLYGTASLVGVGLGGLNGTALDIRNGAGGTSTIVNNGTIGTGSVIGAGVISADGTAITSSGNGNVNMTNGQTGQIVGRVSFSGTEAAGTHNSFTNNGTISGSVYMGDGDDTFIADTGSNVNTGGSTLLGLQVGDLLGVGVLDFAQAGVVDGGAGIDTLGLKNQFGVVNEATASALQYINFENLAISSGRWNLVDGRLANNTVLTGGVAVLNDADNMGDNALSMGGTIESGVNGLNVTTNIETSGAGNLTVQGANDLQLSGQITGDGALIKTGTGALRLEGGNTYTGNTQLDQGRIQVDGDGALGTGLFVVNGPNTALEALSPSTLANNVYLNQDLTVDGVSDLALTGQVVGPAGIIKTGTGSLALSGPNLYQGNTILNEGTLLVGGTQGALGEGGLIVTGDSTLSALPGNATLNNNVGLNAGTTLTVNGANDLTLTAPVAGGGAIAKDGTGTLVLATPNSYAGGTSLAGGGTIDVVSGALGTGDVTVTGSGYISADSGPATLDNNFNVIGNVAFQNPGATLPTNLTLNGDISGSGIVIKKDGGVLTLNGNNSWTGSSDFGGGSTIVAGSDTALGIGPVVIDGPVNLDSNLPVNLANDFLMVGPLTVLGNQDMTLSGSLLLNGSLIKDGPATLTLTGTNSYTGGTTVNGGTLVGDSDSLQGQITNDAVVDFNQTADGTYAGAMTGTGVLVKDGTGTLTLSGPNAYTGGTLINAGTLAGDTTSLQGNIENNANLLFDQEPDGTFAGTIIGTGSLTKDGGGNLTLSGTNTYTGGTFILDGTLTGTTNSLPGNIVNDAILVFDQDFDGTHTGDISGTGSLTKDGAGVVTLSGTSSYTGGTLINAGGLRGDTDSLQGAITDNGALIFDQDTDGTFNGTIAGTGSLTKDGDGIVTIAGPNTYSGGTDLNAGGLNVLGPDALGTGVVRLNGGALSTDGIASLSNPIAVNADSTVGGTGILDLDGPVSGNGDLDKVGTGTVNLNGDLSNFAGILGIDDGLLNVSTEFNGTVAVRGGTLALTGDTDDDVTLNAPVTGTLALGGGNDSLFVPVGSLTGWTGVADGGAGVDGIFITETGDGNAPNGGWLNFENLDIGAGANLNVEAGNALQLPGTTFVNAGAGLRLDGAISGDVVNNGNLIGSGTVGGDLTINGLFAPSGVPGGTGIMAGTGVAGSTFTTNGNLTSNAGAQWIVRVAADGTHDQTNVAGAANINGGTVTALPANGEYGLTNTYTFLTAAGGVTGNFSGVVQNDLPFLSASLVTNPTSVDLVLARTPSNPGGPGGPGTDPGNGGTDPGNGGTNPGNGGNGDNGGNGGSGDNGGNGGNGGDGGTNPGNGNNGGALRYQDFPGINGNQRNMATALQTGEDRGNTALEPILRQVRGLHANEVIPAFDRMTGESYATAATAINQSGRRALQTVLNHGNTGNDPTPANGTGWVVAYGTNAGIDGDKNAGSIQTSERGGVVGVDFVTENNLTWGPYLDYTTTHVDASNGRADHVKSNEFGGGLQATYRPGPWYIKGAISYSQIDLDVDRDARINPGVGARAASTQNGHAIRAGLETGWTFKASGWEIEPMAGAYYGKVNLDSSREDGSAPARLNIGSTSVSETVLGGGARVRHDWKFANSSLQTEFSARYMHSLNNDTASRTMSFGIAPDQPFTIRSARPGSDWTEVGAGVKYKIGGRTNLFANYQAQLGGGTAHSVNVGLSVDW